ncbi:MAG: hypothetical protein SGPRY_013178 [Prymnesium sp.]
MRTEYAKLDNLVGRADTGAQYITQHEATADAHATAYAELREHGLLQLFEGTIEGTRAADGAGDNFITPNGLGEIVQHTFDEAGVELVCNREATSLAVSASESGSLWEVSASDGTKQTFDAVVLTAPVPDQLRLLESSRIDNWINADLKSKLAALEYSSRYAISLFFPAEERNIFDSSISWTAKYINKEEDDALVYVCYDSKKRGQREGAVSLMAHTSVPYGLRQLKAAAPHSEVTADLVQRMQRLFPWM